MSGEAAAGAAPDGSVRRAYALLLRPEASVIVVSVALVAYFELANRNFLTHANVQTVSQFVAAPVIIACGEIMLLICREIDLSVGQVFALAPFLMENVHDFGLPVPLAIVAALAVSALIGFTIGLITIKLSVPSFITTLGMLFLITGHHAHDFARLSGEYRRQPALDRDHGRMGLFRDRLGVRHRRADAHRAAPHALGSAYHRDRRQYRRRGRGRHRDQSHQDRQFRADQHAWAA